jgi:hypothetical protein
MKKSNPKQYKILHIVSGNYCILAPLDRTVNYFVLDFEGTHRPWIDIQKSTDKKLWEWFWNNPGSLELASYLCGEYEYETRSSHFITEHMTKDEFELVAI